MPRSRPRAHRMLRAAALAVLGVVPGGSAAAQAPATVVHARDGSPYRIVRWTTAEGLPQNTINDIAALPTGEVWLATFGGIARFDGMQFRVLDISGDSGLPDNRVIALAPRGRDVWFLTHHGHFGRISGNRATTMVPPALATMETLGLGLDDAGRAYTQSVDGSIWRAHPGERWRRILPGNELIGTLHGIARTATGELWAATAQRLVRLRADDPSHNAVDVPGAHGLFSRSGSGLWVATGAGLGELRDGTLHAVDVRPAFRSKVTTVVQAGPDLLWVAARGEVSRLGRHRDGWWTRTVMPLALPADHMVRSLRVDVHGSLWVGTNGLGLYRIQALPLHVIGAGVRTGAVTALAPDGHGGAYLVDWCHGLVHVSRSGEERRVLPVAGAAARRLATACGTALTPGAPGHVWVRADEHVLDVWDEGRRGRRLDLVVPAEPGPIVAGSDGLWIVSRRGLVQHVAPDGTERRHWTLPSPLVSATLAPDGRLWVGGDGRIFQIGPDAVTWLSAPELPPAEVRDILVEPSGDAWIATYGAGLTRLRPGRISRVTTREGLPDNSISRLLADGRGRLWLSTNRGLAVFERRDLDAAADGAGPRTSPVVIGSERGMREASFGSPAGFRDGDDRLWFGSIEGAAAIDARRFPFNTTPPSVQVTQVVADGMPRAVGQTVSLDAGTSRVRLEFASLPVTYPERVRFRMRVDEVDATWVEIGSQHTIDWSPPGPGRYRLLVAARNEDGIWTDRPAALVLDVAPRWWQTTGARTAAVLTVVLGLGAAYRARVQALGRRHQAYRAMAEQQRGTEARVAELRTHLDHVARVALAGELSAGLAHEISQPVSAMMNNAEAARRYLAQHAQPAGDLAAILDDIVQDGVRASHIVRGVRTFLRPRVSEATPIDLSAVVQEMLPLVEHDLRDRGVTLHRAIGVDLPRCRAVAVQIGQVVVNLVKNAGEALEACDGDRWVRVSTMATDREVCLIVRDNGPGLAPSVAGRAFDAFVTTKPDGLGMGLAICRGIAESHGGRLTARDANPGLEVVLALPITTGDERDDLATTGSRR